MINDRRYKRYFIILENEDRGFEKTDKGVPKGYAKIEVRNGKGLLNVYVQDLKYFKDAKYIYRNYLISTKGEKDVYVDTGAFIIDERGKGELKVRFDPDNVEGSSRAIEDFNVVAVIARPIERSSQQNEVYGPLVGYMDKEKVNWKEVLVSEEENEEIDDDLDKEYKQKYDEIIDVIEKSSKELYKEDVEKKDGSKKEVEQEEYKEDRKDIEKYKKEQKKEYKEYDKNYYEDKKAKCDNCVDSLEKYDNKKMKEKVEAEMKPEKKENIEAEAKMDKNKQYKKESSHENEENLKKEEVKKAEKEDIKEEVKAEKNKQYKKENSYENKEAVKKEEVKPAKKEEVKKAEIKAEVKEEKNKQYKKENSYENKEAAKKEEIKPTKKEEVKKADIKAEVKEEKNKQYKKENSYENKEAVKKEEVKPAKKEEVKKEEVKPDKKADIKEETKIEKEKQNKKGNIYKDKKYGNREEIDNEKQREGTEDRRPGVHYKKYHKMVYKYVKDILKYYEKIQPFEKNIKGYAWWKIHYDKQSMNRGFLPFFGYILNIYYFNPYIYYMNNCHSLMNKYGHYAFGIAYDKDMEPKYYIYGVPGRYMYKDQPFQGMTGFVSWYPLEDKNPEKGDYGYWLLHIDAKTGNVVFPMKPTIPPMY